MIAESILKKTILWCDVKVVEGVLGEVMTFIQQNPFSEKICFLLANQKIAVTPVINRGSKLSEPNCLGTAFYVAGEGSFNHPYHAREDELEEIKAVAPEVKWNDRFLEHPERIVPGAYVFSYSTRMESWHGGIYLGYAGGEYIVFAQHGHGGEFCVETLKNSYSHPNFYPTKVLINT